MHTAWYTPRVRSLCIALLVALGLTLGASIAAPTIARAQGAGYQIHTQEEEGGGRSGFWTSRKPASGGAYRWRLLGIGVGVLAITGGSMLLLIRGAKRSRAAAAAAAPESR